ncbi:MAG: hypothetical protein MZV70_29270 [Desulfobacterales bacterium]|nr:hypothetical protein [Desulfobacterales bacterium]
MRQTELANKYHFLFPNYCCYAEVGDGWKKLLFNLCDHLVEEYQKLSAEEQSRCYITDIKEKFGTLRVYMSTSNKDMEAWIRVAESVAAVTCEFCGNAGKLRYGELVEDPL